MIYAEESQINATEGYRCGDSGVYETSCETPGELFREAVKAHGRCISSVYVDNPDGKVKRVGWVFRKRAKYEDTGEPFILETWVTLHESPPETKVTHHYRELAQ